MNKTRLIYLARLPEHVRAAQKAKLEKKKVIPVESGYMRMKRLLETVEEAILFDEALDVATAQAWLNRAYQTIVDRSEEITNIVEKEEYTKLATVIQAAIPVNNAPEDSVESNLQILRQQIIVGEEDSRTLRKLKMHLITSISEVLVGTADGGGAEDEGGGAPPADQGGAPPADMPPGGDEGASLPAPK